MCVCATKEQPLTQTFYRSPKKYPRLRITEKKERKEGYEREITSGGGRRRQSKIKPGRKTRKAV